MGVIIGSLNSGGAPCVETPDSPEITIGGPVSLTSATQNEYGKTIRVTEESDAIKFADHADIANVRRVKIKRSFYCRKSDINATMAWLSTLSGSALKYSAGLAGEKTATGNFQLDGDVDFSSFSPSISVAKAEFTGAVLDVNFLFPSGLSFVTVDDMNSKIIVGTNTVAEYSTPSDGDGSGLSIVAGDVIYWDELDGELKNSLPMSATDLPEAEDDKEIPSQANVWMNQFRKIHLQMNGYILKTWYLPCLGTFERKRIVAKKLWRGITETEYVEQTYAVSVPFSPLVDPGRYGYDFQYSQNGNSVEYGPGERTGEGSVHFGSYALPNLTGGTWTPTLERTVVSVTPRTYTRYYFAGWDYVSTLIQVANRSPADALVNLFWRTTSTHIQLVGTGFDKVENILMSHVKAV